MIILTFCIDCIIMGSIILHDLIRIFKFIHDVSMNIARFSKILQVLSKMLARSSMALGVQ